MKKIVRVAVSNNFNCTAAEWAQLDTIQAQHPDKTFFVNSNIMTPDLISINDHPYKAVITVNPNLVVPEYKVLHKLDYIAPSKIGFLRVKWVPGPLLPGIRSLIDSLLDRDYAVVITLQRYQKTATLLKYTSREYYEHTCSRFRLAGEALKEVETYVDSRQALNLKAYICDRTGKGCSGCGQCATLTMGKPAEICSLNLSTSGTCPYSCPDCYAKCMSNFSEKMGHAPIRFDVIHKNHKQSGQTAHIKHAMATA